MGKQEPINAKDTTKENRINFQAMKNYLSIVILLFLGLSLNRINF